jgi:hypothetical protein
LEAAKKNSSDPNNISREGDSTKGGTIKGDEMVESSLDSDKERKKKLKIMKKMAREEAVKRQNALRRKESDRMTKIMKKNEKKKKKAAMAEELSELQGDT